jgi:hypothetical protein
VPRPPETKSPFWRRTLESCEREMFTPSLAAISSARRASVQLVRSATGCSRRGPRRPSARPQPSAGQVQGQRSPSAHQSHHA